MMRIFPVLLLVWVTIFANAQLPPAEAAGKLPVYTIVSIKEYRSSTKGSMLMATEDGVQATHIDVPFLLRNAYDFARMTDQQVTGLPAWTHTMRFDIKAKVEDDDVASFKKLKTPERKALLRGLLAEHFGLVAHFETREGAVYALVVAKKGSKLTDAQLKAADGTPRGNSKYDKGSIEADAGSMSKLAAMLTLATGRPVDDKTGLTGRYDIKLLWTPEAQADTAAAKAKGAGIEAPPPLFTALEEQLGLRLEPGRGPVQTLVVDHIQKPTAN